MKEKSLDTACFFVLEGKSKFKFDSKNTVKIKFSRFNTI